MASFDEPSVHDVRTIRARADSSGGVSGTYLVLEMDGEEDAPELELVIYFVPHAKARMLEYAKALAEAINAVPKP